MNSEKCFELSNRTVIGRFVVKVRIDEFPVYRSHNGGHIAN